MDHATPAGLRYVTDTMPGISRRRCGKGFTYLDPEGARIADEATLERIRGLAVPPAYQHVWICPLPNGHLQATGRDDRGRKQYRYHPDYRAYRDTAKYHRLVDFAHALPRLRRRVDQDLRQNQLTRERVLAAAVRLMDLTLIRIGHSRYAQQNHTYGIASLQEDHVQVTRAKIALQFVGKGGKATQREIDAPRVAKTLRKCVGLPGRQLLEYLDPDDQPVTIDAGDVNAYLREHTSIAATSKDFRTWGGTVLAAAKLARLDREEAKTRRKKQIVAVVKEVASALGNTPATCRKHYIHPAVLDAFDTGDLAPHMNDRPRATRSVPRAVLSAEENAVLNLLEAHPQPLAA